MNDFFNFRKIKICYNFEFNIFEFKNINIQQNKKVTKIIYRYCLLFNVF